MRTVTHFYGWMLNEATGSRNDPLLSLLTTLKMLLKYLVTRGKCLKSNERQTDWKWKKFSSQMNFSFINSGKQNFGLWGSLKDKEADSVACCRLLVRRFYLSCDFRPAYGDASGVSRQRDNSHKHRVQHTSFLFVKLQPQTNTNTKFISVMSPFTTYGQMCPRLRQSKQGPHQHT